MGEVKSTLPQARIAEALDYILSVLDPTEEVTVDGYKLPQKRIAAQLERLQAKLQEEGGIYAKVEMHVCSSDEYDHATGVPTIENASEDTFYLVPTGDDSDDMFEEWTYKNGRWEKFGSGGTMNARLGGLSDVAITDLLAGQTIVFNGTSEMWENKSLQPFCFESEDGEEQELVFDGGNIDTEQGG